ncbi:D-alanyl-D-alanine carboxypeptidase/D-alanyl-D-alanine-endopeptidase [bacterium]|nr:D-alanyl-D-alanine carboxypeptidase/D-alanyl-D-alanine-endopeptidase [bacterium]
MSLKLVPVLFLIACVLSGSVFAGESGSTAPEEILIKEFENILNARVCREGKVGLVVKDLKNGDILFQRNPMLPLVPASNQKIVTTIGALGLLSPQFSFKTSVYRNDELNSGVLDGNLYIKGGGDPFLVKEEMWKLAERVESMGITHTKGDIIADSTYFDGIGDPSKDWKRIKMPLWYNAPTGGLAFNFNAISVIATPGKRPDSLVTIKVDPPLDCFEVRGSPKTGPAGSRITLILDIKEINGKCVLLLKGRMPVDCDTQKYYRHVDNSTRYAGYAFKYYLEQVGITIDGDVAYGKTPSTARRVVVHESQPLYALLNRANKFSNNFMIEQTVKTIAAENVSFPGTTMKGLHAIKLYFSDQLGIDTEGMILDDGSGLSRKNRITAIQFTELIRYAVNESYFGPEFLSTLPIAGVDGTMKKRLKNHRTKRLVRAKTGLIDNVVCLSGLIDGRKGEGLVFSIMINRNKCRHRDSKTVQDKLLKSMLKYWNSRETHNEP